MTSDKNNPYHAPDQHQAGANQTTQAYVWIWLPQATDPVVAGVVQQTDGRYYFGYGQSYLARDDAIAIYSDLPLREGVHTPPMGQLIAGALRDATPDAWGRRVILNKLAFGPDADPAQLSEITFMLESGSNRTGNLDFQASVTKYNARTAAPASLETLQRAAAGIESGTKLAPELDAALNHGTSIGGARPKAQITVDDAMYVAKFASSSDQYSVVRCEYAAMKLAAQVGIDAAQVELHTVAGKDVLLVRRFDRVGAPEGAQRLGIVSGLTLLGLDEMQARYASYIDLAQVIRARFVDPIEQLRELFRRMCFNILIGNNDDHARNHAAFWDGTSLRLTPAYDICPQLQIGQESTQAMRISQTSSHSQLVNCLAAAPYFMLGADQARAIIDAQITTIEAAWPQIVQDAGLSPLDERLLYGHRILSPYAFNGYRS